MEEVLEKFEANLTTGQHGSQTKFEGLYKNWGKFCNQEERRKELLDFQKSKRQDKLDNFRGILDLVNAVEEAEYYSSESQTRYRPSIYVAGFHRASPTYKDILMLSEWMVEKPADFCENWYVVPCPKAVRMLVVANQGTTKCYTKFGQFRFQKRTAFPSGNPCDGRKRHQCYVLDCFYSEKNNTMYILDLLAWNSQPMTDGETEFRHYWLTQQLEELPGLKTINKKNQIIFKLLPKVSCDRDPFNKFMMKFPHFDDHYPSLDGLLFYHRKAHYISGETPLVGWLFPFMVPEIIGPDVTVNEAHMLGKPLSYTNQADYIQKFEEKYAKKKRSPRISKVDKMDATDIEESENLEQNTEEAKTEDTMDAENLVPNTDMDEDSEKNIENNLSETTENINKE